jgi:hypothetical protein
MHNLFTKKPFAKHKSNNLFVAHCLLLIAYCLLPFTTKAQTNQTITYTTKEGLPSNSIYRTIIDKRGFLWIATETGVSRFDGKKFRNYSTVDGLADNEITDLLIDSSGTIWVIPFSRTACYYNETTDRFENETSDKILAKLELYSTFRPNVLQYGGIAFCSRKRDVLVVKNKQIIRLPSSITSKSPIPICVIEYSANNYLIISEDSVRRLNNGNEKVIFYLGKDVAASEVDDRQIFFSTANSILVYEYNSRGDFYFVKEKKYPFDFRIFCKTGKHFALTSLNGTTYLLDKKTLEPLEIISETDGVPVRNVLEDKDENIWLSTIDKGLVKVQKKRISVIDNKDLKQNFNAILKSKKLIVGNNNGELFCYDGLYTQKILLNNNKNIDGWTRKILNTPYGIYVSSQSGSYFVDEKSFTIKKSFNTKENTNKSTKAAYLLNDSILLLGGHAFAYKFNLKTQTILDSVGKRVVSLGADKNENIYIGSNEGLFLWKDQKAIPLGEKRNALSYKVNAMTCSPDNLMWVGLGADSVFVLNDNNIIASIPLGKNIPGTGCRSLFSNKIGEVWLGTNKGINRINYTFANSKFEYYSTYFGVSDGLSGEQVNDITIQDSLVYMATNEGINAMPVNLQLPVSNIATYITGVQINNVAVPIKNEYKLKYSENDVTIDFSGVDLTGFIPIFEYSQNNGEWLQTQKIELKSLEPGNYLIKIRAIRRDGKPSTQEAVLKLVIKTPFWKSSIFWAVLAFSIFGAILFFQQQQNKQKQKIVLEKITTEKRLTELEMQALKAQINPHFVFNCLNSIKGFIYDKDYLQADKYLDKFSELMRSTIDNSDAAIISLDNEISYLTNYLQLEKLRFEDKFNYEFEIDKNIDTQKLFVPAMLLQPYVENAIRHGMRFLENKKGEIKITTKIGDDKLVCTIDDNGIGREKANLLKSKRHVEYQSKGMSISKRRAELYNIEQQIIDKKDENGNASGTAIIVKIPITLKP